MSLLKKVCILIICIIFITNLTYSNEKKLPDGVVIGDTEGVKVSIDGKYFIYANNIAPGDTIKKKVLMKNNTNNILYNLFLSTSNIIETGNINMADRILITIKVQDKVIFTGDPSGKGSGDFANLNMKKTPLFLGKFYPDEIKDMDVDFFFQGEELKSTETGSILFDWAFSASFEEYVLPKAGF